MEKEETKKKILEAFNRDYESLDNFRDKYSLMRNIKIAFNDIPESVIYLVIDRLCRSRDYKADKEKFKEAFVNQIFPVITGKSLE